MSFYFYQTDSDKLKFYVTFVKKFISEGMFETQNTAYSDDLGSAWSS